MVTSRSRNLVIWQTVENRELQFVDQELDIDEEQEFCETQVIRDRGSCEKKNI